jgi:hypothetical protein
MPHFTAAFGARRIFWLKQTVQRIPKMKQRNFSSLRSRPARKFERFVLPLHAHIPAELHFPSAPNSPHIPVRICDLSAFGLGLALQNGKQIPPLRRKVEVRLESGAFLEGLTIERDLQEGETRLGIALKADGYRFEDLTLLPDEQKLSLDSQIRQLVPVQILGGLQVGLALAGETGVPSQGPLPVLSEGDLRIVTANCVVVNVPFLKPGLLVGLNCDFQVALHKSRHSLNCEISDIRESVQGGVDIVLSYTDTPKSFLAQYVEFYVDQKSHAFKASLRSALRDAGFVS